MKQFLEDSVSDALHTPKRKAPQTKKNGESFAESRLKVSVSQLMNEVADHIRTIGELQSKENAI